MSLIDRGCLIVTLVLGIDYFKNTDGDSKRWFEAILEYWDSKINTSDTHLYSKHSLGLAPRKDPTVEAYSGYYH